MTTTAAPIKSVARVAMPEGTLAKSDPEIARLIDLEVDRQRHGLELIASENFVSPAVLEAMGTPLTNKYAEGLPVKRYYGGCEFVDMVEQLAIDRVKKLFDADHANVQAHSGAQANAAVYLAFLKPGDLVLGFFFSSRRRHTRLQGDWSSDVCSSDLSPKCSGARCTRHATRRAARARALRRSSPDSSARTRG